MQPKSESKAPPTPNRIKLSLCMIARDEAEVIARCLESALPAVDEIIVVDTGSSDSTMEVARRFGARVIECPWTDDFSAPRNVSLRAANGEWILVLDADEWLAAGSAEKIRKALGEGGVVAYHVPIVNDYGDGRRLAFLIARVFRNVPGVAFENRIHEQVLPSLHRYAATRRLRVSTLDAPILHGGYTAARVTARGKKERDRRLFELQLRERPDDLYTWYKYADFLRGFDDPDATSRALREGFRLLRRAPRSETRFLPYAPELAALRALAILSDGHAQRAYRVALCASQRFVDSAHLRLVLGAAAARLDRHAEAALAFGRCIELARQVSAIPAQPGVEADARRRLAASLAAIGRGGEAEAALREAVERDPADAESAELYASVLALRGDFASAFRALAEAVRSNSGRRSTWLVGGTLLLRSGVPSLAERAEAWLARALELRGQYGDRDVRILLGEARLRAGDLEGARRHWSGHVDDARCRVGCSLVDWALGKAPALTLTSAEDHVIARMWIEAAPAECREHWSHVWLARSGSAV